MSLFYINIFLFITLKTNNKYNIIKIKLNSHSNLLDLLIIL